MDFFVCRVRTKTIHDTLFQYVEYLCEYDKCKGKLKLVKSVTDTNSYYLNDVNNTFKVQVLTSASVMNTLPTPYKAVRELVWLVKDDFIGKGSFVPQHVKNKCVYFDTKISTRDSLKILRHGHDIRILLGCNLDPLSLYHGSGGDSKDSILYNGLFPSFGMLGDGVYLGTFFKACRYASRHQDYSLRTEGFIFRCLVFVSQCNITEYPNLTHACKCHKCIVESSGFERVSDHLSLWNTKMGCGVAITVSDSAFGFKKSGEPKYLVKNAEWAFQPEFVCVQEFAPLDLSSVMGPHYHPLQRNCKVLW